MMHNSAVFKYSFGWEQVLTVSACKVQKCQFPYFSLCECSEHHFVPSLLIKHSTLITFARSETGREALETGREAIAQWPGKVRSAEETGTKGQLSPTRCECLQWQGGRWSGQSQSSYWKEMYISLLMHFSAFPSVYLKHLEHFHISIFLNNSHFLYQEYHAGLFKKQREPQKYSSMRGVLCNLRKSVQAIDKFLFFLSIESMFKGFQSVWFHQRCFFLLWVLSVR